MSDDTKAKGEAKTAQPFSDDNNDTSYKGMTGGEPKPRPDDVGDPKKKAESNKVTQREE